MISYKKEFLKIEPFAHALVSMLDRRVVQSACASDGAQKKLRGSFGTVSSSLCRCAAGLGVALTLGKSETMRDLYRLAKVKQCDERLGLFMMSQRSLMLSRKVPAEMRSEPYLKCARANGLRYISRILHAAID